MEIHIEKFCRAFDNVHWSEEYNCWVSGGYAFQKIALPSREVPPEISELVNSGYFSLNDNYPPERDDFALIAKEIGSKYAILVVANRQLDDGGRPTVGYKYFWLEKKGISDGIGALISWWSESEKKFDMHELDQSQYSQPETFTYDYENIQSDENTQTAEEIQEIPFLKVVENRQNYVGRPEYLELHCRALALSKLFQLDNVWAWNINKLQVLPKDFIAVYYRSKSDIPHITKRQLSRDNLKNGKNSPSLNYTTPSVIHLKSIKNCLADLAEKFKSKEVLDRKKRAELFNYIKEYINADWSNCIDQTMMKNSPIYGQLIYLISPSHAERWLLNVVNSVPIRGKNIFIVNNLRERFKKNGSIQEPKSTSFQDSLLKAALEDDDSEVLKKFEDSIYYGISLLLGKLMITNNSNQEKQQIEEFLIRKPSIWRSHFMSYTKIVAEMILKRNHDKSHCYPSLVESWEQISDLVSNQQSISQILNRKRNPPQEFRKYRPWAVFFSKTEKKDLSEFLYIVSGYDEIPEEIKNCISEETKLCLYGTELYKQRIKILLEDLVKDFSDVKRLNKTKSEELFRCLSDYPKKDLPQFVEDLFNLNLYWMNPNPPRMDKERLSWLLLQVIYFTSLNKELVDKCLSETMHLYDKYKDFGFQAQLLKASCNFKDKGVHKELESYIYFGISFLLSKNTNQEENGKIERFLDEKESIWKKYFEQYKNIVKKIISGKDKIDKYPWLVELSESEKDEITNDPCLLELSQPILTKILAEKNAKSQDLPSEYMKDKILAVRFNRSERTTHPMNKNSKLEDI